MDVGVLSYSFVLVFLVWVGSLVHGLSIGLVWLVGFLRFSFGSLVECFLFDSLVGWVIGFLGGLDVGWLMAGGAEC
ncbi:MAG: hypothetical protein PSU94_10540 [Lacunisphaera sp.]|nr:hypothetical protein [Lacunisphaera sp.]